MGSTVAVIAGGAMGSALAARLTRHGLMVLTSLAGRSARSVARSEAAGMRDAEDAEIVARADLLLSIVPPSEARGLAERFAGPIRAAGRSPVFADCNAIGVDEVTAIGDIVSGAGGRFADAAIIGFPPHGDDPGPTIYACGPGAEALEGLNAAGLRVVWVDGPVGAASALKLSYAGITKGLVAVAAAMILAAERAGAGEGLMRELAASQPQLLARFGKTLPDMYPKAYRWIDEMHAIAGFIGTGRPEALMFEGAAGLYDRLAADGAGTAAEQQVIDAFLRRPS